MTSTQGIESGLPYRDGSDVQVSRGSTPAAGYVAGLALLCCAATHAAAAYSHRSSGRDVALFAATAGGQALIGVLALRRWGKLVRALIIGSSVVVTGAWLMSRTRGLPWSSAESVGMGDAIAAGLQVVAASLAMFVPALPRRSRGAIPALTGGLALALGSAALAVPATIRHGESEELVAGSISAVWGSHAHVHTAQADAGLTGNGIVNDQPQACNATAAEVRAADDLVARTTFALQKWDTPEKAVADGFVPLGFEPNGVHHYLNQAFMDSETALDPNEPESIVYGRRPDGELRPIGAMFMMHKQGVRGPRPGGCLMTWHTHGWPFARPGEQSPEMVHIWTIQVPAGPFAHESGPDYARIYLNKKPVGADEVNVLLEDLRAQYETGKLDPKVMAAAATLAFATEESRCAKEGRDAMSVLKVSAALQDQVCDPLLSAPVPGDQRGGLFSAIRRGLG